MALGYIIYIAFIVIACFWAGRKWLGPYLSTDRDLDTLTNKLTELEDKQNPHERIQEFHQWIRENAHSPFMKEFVLPSWKDYYEKYKQCNQKGLPFTPDIYDFFLEDNLMQRFGKRKLVDAVPGVLLSLGIIGTFFGIAVGVSGLNASGNAEAMQSGISTLLGGMKVKFASSIAGISLAVIWQMVDKMKFYPKLTSNFRTLRQKLDLTFPTQEQSTVLSQMLVNQEKQMGDFQAYVSETMIPNIVSGMSEAITQSLTPHLEETQSMMKSMIDQALVNQVEGIHSMVDYFVQSLSDITGDHMKEFGQALQTTVEWQQRVHEEMSELVQSMQDSAKEQLVMVEKTTALTGQINSYTEKIIDYHSVMENMIDQSNETTEKNGQLQVIISELLEKMTAERQVFHEHFDTHVNYLESRISEFSEQTEQQLDLSNKLAANLERYHSLSQSHQLMVEKTTTLTGQINNYTEKITDYHSVMENMINQSNETTEKNGQLQVNISELLGKMTAERQVFHEHFDTHVNYLESRISEFSEQTEQQLDLSNKLAANLERYHSLSESQQLMVEKTTALTGQINNYTEKITDYHSVMENMINQLNETTEKNGQLQVNISELLEKMTAERQVFHEHFDTHVNHLESRISEFSEQTEQQLDLNNKLAANLEHYHSLSQSQQELSETLANQAALSKESNEETVCSYSNNE